ncbi:hypothetical protein BGZ96_006903 [Linnemannia gamsii]|uniref:F-box domain-containing protein n=1 Tax=Linnemannia gamsii TaxID=64522 RepID=A0ABQ7KGF6_9FUNG|nr:hypothetical protein BGZ96_006903 [Linnemannia gamsii]
MDWSEDRDCNGDIARALRANHHLIRSVKLQSLQNNLRSFLDCCPPTFPHLTSAEIEGWIVLEDEMIAQFIDLSSAGWKRLVFRATQNTERYLHFRWQSFESLLGHVATLETLRFETKCFVKGSQLNQLLCSATRLRELYFSGDGTILGGCLQARKIVQSEWACKDLEVFSCRIGYVPRPDIVRIARDLPRDPQNFMTTPQESIHIQRQVYSKLAQFTKLRELLLGSLIDITAPRYRRGGLEYWRQYECLAMTLESGLDLLKGLKELRVVGLENMEVYIEGKQEKAWFAEYWPHVTIRTTDIIDENNIPGFAIPHIFNEFMNL